MFEHNVQCTVSETYVVGCVVGKEPRKLSYIQICTYIVRTRFTKTVDVKIYIRKSFLIAIDGTVIKLTLSLHKQQQKAHILCWHFHIFSHICISTDASLRTSFIL